MEQDLDVFIPAHLQLLKAICRKTVRLNRKDCRKAMVQAYLSLSPEQTLDLTHKLVTTLSVTLRKQRQLVTGERLKGHYRALLEAMKSGKVQRQSGKSSQEKQSTTKKGPEPPSSETAPASSELIELSDDDLEQSSDTADQNTWWSAGSTLVEQAEKETAAGKEAASRSHAGARQM